MNLIEIVAFRPRCISHGNAVHGSTLTVSMEAVGFRPTERKLLLNKLVSVVFFFVVVVLFSSFCKQSIDLLGAKK